MKNTISSNIEEVQAHNLEDQAVLETQKELKNIQHLLKNQLKAEKGLSKFLDDPEKYIGKNISDQTTNMFGKVKKKLGFARGGIVEKQMQDLFAGSK